jgi:hypothetical protein
VVVVGDEAAIAEAVARTRDQERVTGLPVLLQAGAVTKEAPPPSPLSIAMRRGSDLPPQRNDLPVPLGKGRGEGRLPSPPQRGGAGGGASFTPADRDPDGDPDDASDYAFVDDTVVYDPMPDDWPD